MGAGWRSLSQGADSGSAYSARPRKTLGNGSLLSVRRGGCFMNGRTGRHRRLPNETASWPWPSPTHAERSKRIVTTPLWHGDGTRTCEGIAADVPGRVLDPA